MTNQNPFRLTTLVTAVGIAFGAIGAGCGDTSARRIETGGPQSITTVDQIDDQDWAEAANKLVQSVVDQGIIARRRDGKPTRVAVRKFVNNTSQMVDVDLLIKQVTIGLNKTGNVRSIVEDAESTMNTGSTLAPDYRLSGKLIENRAQAGRVKQSTFYFQMSLYDAAGENVWEDQVPITKAGSKNSVGF
jgi:PBP1b-binding outer membrane lipoprotein LpoB